MESKDEALKCAGRFRDKCLQVFPVTRATFALRETDVELYPATKKVSMYEQH
jgi:hypothetical protein